MSGGWWPVRALSWEGCCCPRTCGPARLLARPGDLPDDTPFTFENFEQTFVTREVRSNKDLYGFDLGAIFHLSATSELTVNYVHVVGVRYVNASRGLSVGFAHRFD